MSEAAEGPKRAISNVLLERSEHQSLGDLGIPDTQRERWVSLAVKITETRAWNSTA